MAIYTEQKTPNWLLFPKISPMAVSGYSSSARTAAVVLHLLLCLLLSATRGYGQTNCKKQSFSKNRLFSTCVDLPHLSSFIHWTYDAPTSTLALAFTATPSTPEGWISWGINPAGPVMSGAQALVAFPSAGGAVVAKTYNVSSYRSIVQGKILYEVPELEAESDGGSSGSMRIFAKMVLPEGMATVNHVWQIGPSVQGDLLATHSFANEDLQSKGTLDLLGGGFHSAGGSDLKDMHIHGILNAVSWGLLLPIGAIIARYLKTFKSADPAWFYLHVSCQITGYAVGVAGWGTGLKLGSQSPGSLHPTHRSIGIALFCLGTIQAFALFLRPKRDHKYRIYWNAYHLSVGYVVIILGIFNVFKGINILNPPQKWKTAYIALIGTLAGIAAVLEAVTWVIVLKKRNKSRSASSDKTQFSNGNHA